MGLLKNILKDLFGGIFSRKATPEEMDAFKRRVGKRSAETILSAKWVWQDHETMWEGEPNVKINRKGQRSVSGKQTTVGWLTTLSDMFGINSEDVEKLEVEYSNSSDRF